MLQIQGKYGVAKVMIDNIDEATSNQIYEFVSHPAFTEPIAIMPDTHAGKGCVVGFTMPVGDKIVPNTIGVDIGCGMISVNIGNKLNHDLATTDKLIRSVIPLGFHVNSKPVVKTEEFDALCEKTGPNPTRIQCSIGTLGGGNHFIEIGRGTNDDYWITVHTGSRNLGKCVCDYHQKKAIQKIEESRSKYMEAQKEIILKTVDKKNIQTALAKAKNNFGVSLQNKTLAYLEGDDMEEYLLDMRKAQEYADLNRRTIIERILKAINAKEQDRIVSVHNYVDFSDNVIRKGAIRSYVGERLIIPFNMRDGTLICEGKSNPEWNNSAPHGAGRVLSRASAKKAITLETFKEQMNGIYSTSVTKNTLDEAPDAYKDYRIIEDAIQPTVKIIDRLKPILNIKA